MVMSVVPLTACHVKDVDCSCVMWSASMSNALILIPSPSSKHVFLLAGTSTRDNVRKKRKKLILYGIIAAISYLIQLFEHNSKKE